MKLNLTFQTAVIALLLSALNSQISRAFGFEGRIHASITQGGQSQALLYTVGTNLLRVEMTDTNRPNAIDVLDRKSGQLTLFFPHNRSFVRLQPAAENSSSPPGFPSLPAGLRPGVGPQAQPPGLRVTPDHLPPRMPSPGLPTGIVATNWPSLPGPPGTPAMPERPALPTPPAGLPPGIGPQVTAPVTPAIPPMAAMPMMPMEQIELKVTGEKTNLLGFACEKFEIKQRGEVMEIWATEQLPPFQNYVRNQPPRFGPRMIEEQWAGLVTAKKVFPLRASLRFENGPERYRFEVQSVSPKKLTEEDQKLFRPPEGYFEIQPLPF